MRVAFRCDASLMIGTGHVMRCLSFALHLKQHGHPVLFILRHILPSVSSFLSANDISFRLLPWLSVSPGLNDYAAWLGVPEDQDAAATADALADFQPDWLVVDHYGLNDCFERHFSASGIRVCALDDLQRRHLQVHMLIDPNRVSAKPGDDSELCSAPCPALFLCGPKYAFIRDDFLLARHLREQTPPLSGSLMLFFGGSDVAGLTLRVLSLLTHSYCNIPHLVVVAGKDNPDLGVIRELAARGGADLHVQTQEMPGLMQRCEMIMCTASSVNWERCVVGVPAILLVVADNQIPIAEQSGQDGSAMNLGHHDRVSDEQILAAVQCLMNDKSRRSAMAEAARHACDGEGCRRVREQMEFIP